MAKQYVSQGNVYKYTVKNSQGGVLGFLYYRIAKIVSRTNASEVWEEKSGIALEKYLDNPLEKMFRLELEGPVELEEYTPTVYALYCKELMENSVLLEDKKEFLCASAQIDCWVSKVMNLDIG